MSIFVKTEKGKYIDSLETLFATSVLMEQKGIKVGYVGVASNAFKNQLKDDNLYVSELDEVTGNDFAIVADAETKEDFEEACKAVYKTFEAEGESKKEETYVSVEAALKNNPKANLVSVAVPGEYALGEVKKALNLGLHCVVFSNNVPLEDEREMKELAREKGLLCMGPDCGVANINGAALVLSSINNRGPFGIVGASGCGIQHVAAIMHDAGSGVSQTIGTGGNDLKDPVGGIMMLMGIDALEADPKTKYIAVISRKPGEKTFPKVLERISKCKKPVVALFMGCKEEEVTASGAIYASSLDDCAIKCLKLIGIDYHLPTDEDLMKIAKEEVKKLGDEQKYVRGAFSGGTYMEEACNAMIPLVGPVYSNKAVNKDWQLKDSHVSVENCCVDYGEEEFTMGRPHPAIDPSVREPAIMKEAFDPETAVILMDYILTPPGHQDPAGYSLNDIKSAMDMAEIEGRHLIFVVSVLGTSADFQNLDEQKKKLRDAGVIVMPTNYTAARLAGYIVKMKKESD